MSTLYTDRMMTKKTPKNAYKYICEKCDFKCCKLSDYNRHLTTLKHKMMTNDDTKTPKNADITKAYICECGKEYKYRQGLSTHKKKCGFGKNDIAEIEMLKEIIKNQEMMHKLELKDKELDHANDKLDHANEKIKLKDDMIGAIQTGQGSMTNCYNNNNTYNQKFNLNLFLNEDCKDALNIMDFVTSVKVKMNEVEDVGKLGYAEGIGRIFVRALNELDVHQRPIHCSDLKRETLYIKDENGWEKEDDTNPKIKKSIRYLAHQNVKAIPEWKEANSSWQKRHSQTEEQYYKITGNSMGACEPEGNEKNYNKIIRKLAKEVTIDKKGI